MRRGEGESDRIDSSSIIILKIIEVSLPFIFIWQHSIVLWIMIKVRHIEWVLDGRHKRSPQPFALQISPVQSGEPVRVTDPLRALLQVT
jgi:hypothetical protein